MAILKEYQPPREKEMGESKLNGNELMKLEKGTLVQMVLVMNGQLERASRRLSAESLSVLREAEGNLKYLSEQIKYTEATITEESTEDGVDTK